MNEYQIYTLEQLGPIVDANVSGLMDSCKQLYIFGTTTPNNTNNRFAQIKVNYQAMNIPASTSVAGMDRLYKENINEIKTYTHLSGHYSKRKDNNYLTSEILKLQFSEPVPTYDTVTNLINNISVNYQDLLKQHNNWPQSLPAIESWLQQMPHKTLFENVSTYIINKINQHDTCSNPHAQIFKNYVLTSDISEIMSQFTSLITEQSSDRLLSYNILGESFQHFINELSAAILNHNKAENKEDGDRNDYKQYAHAAIFSQYDKSTVVTAKDDIVIEKMNKRFEEHNLAGTTQHKDLAPKQTPEFIGTITINDSNLITNPAGIYINTENNNFINFKSIKTTNYSHSFLGDNSLELVIETGNTGKQPIKIQQTANNGSKRIATLLDENGNTQFPGSITITKDLNCNNSIFGKTLDISSNASINKASFSHRSTINIDNLSLSDKSQNIPNTQWVQNVISKSSSSFGVSLQEKKDNQNYFPIVPIGSTIDSVQNFGYLTTVSFNPYSETVSCINLNTSKNITVQNNLIVESQITCGNTIIKSNIITCETFSGTATRAQYDSLGNEINTTVKVFNKSDSTSYPVVFCDNSTDGSKISIYKNSNILINPASQAVIAPIFEGKASRANWADLAEIYQTDIQYPIGTLVQFGGKKQLTEAHEKINGVISDKPAYLMNSDGIGQPMALIGKVQVRIIGKVNKFDYIGLSNIPGIGIVVGQKYIDGVIGIALQSSNQDKEKLILCSIQLHI